MHNQAEVSALFLLIVFSAEITVHLKLLAYFSSFLLIVSRLGWRMLCKTHTNKLSSFSSSDDIVENKYHKYQEGIWNRKTNSFVSGFGLLMKTHFLMLKLKKKMRRNSWRSANNCVWRFVSDFVILSKARYQALGIMYKGKEKSGHVQASKVTAGLIKQSVFCSPTLALCVQVY